MAWKIPDGLNFLWLYVVVFRITESMKITLRSHHRVALTLMTVMGLTFAAVAEGRLAGRLCKGQGQIGQGRQTHPHGVYRIGLVSALQGARQKCADGGRLQTADAQEVYPA